GVDNPVGPAPDPLQAAALFLDPLLNGAGDGQGMAAPAPFEAADKHVIGGLEKQNTVLVARPLQPFEGFVELVEEVAAPHVADDRDPVDGAGLPAHLVEAG